MLRRLYRILNLPVPDMKPNIKKVRRQRGRDGAEFDTEHETTDPPANNQSLVKSNAIAPSSIGTNDQEDEKLVKL